MEEFYGDDAKKVVKLKLATNATKWKALVKKQGGQ